VCPYCGATLIVELTEAEAEQMVPASDRSEPMEPAAPWPPLAPTGSAPAPSEPIAAATPAPSQWATFGSPAAPVAPPAPQFVYAGFWRRRLAAFLDGIVLFALAVPFFVLWMLPHNSVTMEQYEAMSSEQQMEILGSYLLYFIVVTLTEFLYFSLFESSRRRATLGRMAMGIVVVDVHGRRIHLGRALGRRLARILSGLTLLIGFLIQLFTRRRQALHDKIAGTLVVREGT
jgi:uncharacterized RDD family membrane protein YckC